MTYPDQLRDALAHLRFDAVAVKDGVVSFYWLGRPVYMAREGDDHMVHVRGDTALQLN
jgi:hypothetical protein